MTGTYVAAGTLGDADGTMLRSLRATPVTLHISRSRVTGVECPRSPSLAREIEARLARTPNLDRVGLLGFGVNIGLSSPMGDVFTDQKIPGVHLSLGETDQDVDVDRTHVIRQGRYLL